MASLIYFFGGLFPACQVVNQFPPCFDTSIRVCRAEHPDAAVRFERRAWGQRERGRGQEHRVRMLPAARQDEAVD